jgi:hypothetical protein
MADKLSPAGSRQVETLFNGQRETMASFGERLMNMSVFMSPARFARVQSAHLATAQHPRFAELTSNAQQVLRGIGVNPDTIKPQQARCTTSLPLSALLEQKWIYLLREQMGQVSSVPFRGADVLNILFHLSHEQYGSKLLDRITPQLYTAIENTVDAFFQAGFLIKAPDRPEWEYILSPVAVPVWNTVLSDVTLPPSGATINRLRLERSWKNKNVTLPRKGTQLNLSWFHRNK